MSGYDHARRPGPEDALFYGRDLKPMPSQDLLTRFADPANRFLAWDMAGSKTVITAWLGSNQWESDEGKLYVFGTILHVNVSDEYTDERFSCSEDEALATHAETAQRLRT